MMNAYMKMSNEELMLAVGGRRGKKGLCEDCQLKHLEMPTHVLIENLKDETSMVLAEQIMTMDKRFLDRKIGDCKEIEDKINRALMEQIGIKRREPLSDGGKEKS